MNALGRRVALVTGASRGIGRGVAIGLGEAGATVVVTGRTAEDVEATAKLVTQAGGRGIGAVCDHRRDDQVHAVFARVQQELGRLDVLVNNATAVSDLPLLFAETPFWELPVQMWDDLFDVGLRSHFVASAAAAPLMNADGGRLIVNISSAGAIARIGAVLPYGVAKTVLDRMTADMAEELREHHVTALSLWPPPTSTSGMLAAAGADDDPTAWSVPEFTGRVVAALAASDPFSRTGQSFRARDLAEEFGVHDVLYASEPLPFAAAASPVASIAPSAVKSCRRRDLVARFAGGGMGTGNDFGLIVIWNTSATPCRVAGAVTFIAFFQRPSARHERTSEPPCPCCGSDIASEHVRIPGWP